MSAMRDIDKAGGLDEYLLKGSSQKHLGEFGQALKVQILEARLESADRIQKEEQSNLKQLQSTKANQLQIDEAFKQARRIEAGTQSQA